MTDQDVRDFLERMAAEEPVQFLDAEPLTRRARRRAARTVAVMALGAAAAIAVLFASVPQLRGESPRIPVNPPEESSLDLGIFEPVAGRIVYSTDSSLWAVDPSAPSPSTLVRVEGTDDTGRASFTMPLGWSSDGSELLLLREDPTDQTFPYRRHLYILYADGTETQVTPEPVDGAAISPDGSRVVFADHRSDGLYVVDAEGGQPVRIADGAEPTFSPDGTQIAYLGLPRSGCCVQKGREHVWVANADGTDAHEILADEPALADGASDLSWSPAGDRIAMGNAREGHVAIYTFAPDGSDFTKVITGGMNAFWSPDGSRLAYMLPYGDPLAAGRPLAIADADGSNVQVFDFGGVGPWHPGTLEAGIEATAPPSPSTSPSTSPGSTRFTSTIHGISIDHPSGWQTRPATEPWTGEALDFASPAADVIFDPALGDRLYLVVASQPFGGLSQDEWRNKAIDWLCTGEGMAAGSWTVDGADAFVLECDSTRQAALAFTDTRGYLIRLVVPSEDPGLARKYDFDWFKPVLDSIDLRPEEASGAPSSSASQ
ncbi:MAG: hypothetical protein OEV60_09905 [Actinomycetota bacterium]|nr:hypothetical protein [Actinomycetota bacterium]